MRKTRQLLLALKMEGGQRAKECRQRLEPGKGKEMTFPREPPEGTQSY